MKQFSLSLFLILFATNAFASLSSFYETSSLGYTPLNQAGDSALGAMIFVPATDAIPLICKGAGSPTADLQQWQLAAGTVVAKIDKAGNVTALSATLSGATATTVPYLDSAKKLTSSAVTPTELGYMSGVTSAIQTQIAAKAPLASPTFTGTVTLPSGTVSSSAWDTGSSTFTSNGVAFTAKAPLASPALTGTPTIAGSKASDVAFVRSCTITSAAAATAIHCLVDADIGSGKKAYVTYWHAKVNGATLWATTATCSIQDTNGTPVSFVDIGVAALTGNAFVQAATVGVTLNSPFSLGTGGTASKGLDIACNANGTGSDLVVTIAGFMK